MADTSLDVMTLTPPTLYAASLDGEILTVANGALGNADTSYTYIPLVKTGLNSLSLQWIITATTLTFEFSNSAPDVANTSAVWSDQTANLTGAATVTATGSLTITVPFAWSRMRIKRLTTNATNALRLVLTRMRIQ
jgi:hypothetical protein